MSTESDDGFVMIQKSAASSSRRKTHRSHLTLAWACFGGIFGFTMMMKQDDSPQQPQQGSLKAHQEIQTNAPSTNDVIHTMESTRPQPLVDDLSRHDRIEEATVVEATANHLMRMKTTHIPLKKRPLISNDDDEDDDDDDMEMEHYEKTIATTTTTTEPRPLFGRRPLKKRFWNTDHVLIASRSLSPEELEEIRPPVLDRQVASIFPKETTTPRNAVTPVWPDHLESTNPFVVMSEEAMDINMAWSHQASSIDNVVMDELDGTVGPGDHVPSSTAPPLHVCMDDSLVAFSPLVIPTDQETRKVKKRVSFDEAAMPSMAVMRRFSPLKTTTTSTPGDHNKACNSLVSTNSSHPLDSTTESNTASNSIDDTVVMSVEKEGWNDVDLSSWPSIPTDDASCSTLASTTTTNAANGNCLTDPIDLTTASIETLSVDDELSSRSITPSPGPRQGNRNWLQKFTATRPTTTSTATPRLLHQPSPQANSTVGMYGINRSGPSSLSSLPIRVAIPSRETWTNATWSEAWQSQPSNHHDDRNIIGQGPPTFLRKYISPTNNMATYPTPQQQSLWYACRPSMLPLASATGYQNGTTAFSKASLSYHLNRPDALSNPGVVSTQPKRPPHKNVPQDAENMPNKVRLPELNSNDEEGATDDELNVTPRFTFPTGVARSSRQHQPPSPPNIASSGQPKDGNYKFLLHASTTIPFSCQPLPELPLGFDERLLVSGQFCRLEEPGLECRGYHKTSEQTTSRTTATALNAPNSITARSLASSSWWDMLALPKVGSNGTRLITSSASPLTQGQSMTKASAVVAPEAARARLPPAVSHPQPLMRRNMTPTWFHAPSNYGGMPMMTSATGAVAAPVAAATSIAPVRLEERLALPAPHPQPPASVLGQTSTFDHVQRQNHHGQAMTRPHGTVAAPVASLRLEDRGPATHPQLQATATTTSAFGRNATSAFDQVPHQPTAAQNPTVACSLDSMERGLVSLDPAANNINNHRPSAAAAPGNIALERQREYFQQLQRKNQQLLQELQEFDPDLWKLVSNSRP